MRVWEGYEHGINLGGWLSQCDHTKERYDTFITEKDIKKISKWNRIDHIRVPVDYDLVETAEGEYKEEGFSYIDKAISWAEKYGLHMILDLHKTFGFSFDDGEGEEGFFQMPAYQERFYRLWEEFARRYGSRTDLLAFELLNEVTDKEYADVWNRIADKCITRIRKIAPDIKILVGGYYNNSVVAVKDLALPHDENIIYNFHCYEPILFTHQGAYWINTMPADFRFSLHENFAALREQGGRVLPFDVGFEEFSDETKIDENFFIRLFEEAARVAEERNVLLYCGEYGVINLADPHETLLWYQMINKAFEKYGIGHAAWSYKEMDFGLIDAHMDEVRDELLEII